MANSYNYSANRLAAMSPTNRFIWDGTENVHFRTASVEFFQSPTPPYSLRSELDSAISTILSYDENLGDISTLINAYPVWCKLEIRRKKDNSLFYSGEGTFSHGYLSFFQKPSTELLGEVYVVDAVIGRKSGSTYTAIGNLGIGTYHAETIMSFPKIISYECKDKNPTTLAITGDERFIIQKHSLSEVRITDYAWDFDYVSPYQDTFMEVATNSNVFNRKIVSPFVLSVDGVVFDESNFIIALYSRPNWVTPGEGTVIPGMIEANLHREFYIPYFPPLYNSASFTRGGENSREVTLTTRVTLSTILVNNVEKNWFSHVYFRAQRNTHDAIWSNWEDVITYATIENNQITIENLLIGSYDEAYTYNFEVRVDDRLSYSVLRASIAPGEDAIILDPNVRNMKLNYDLSLHNGVQYTSMVQQKDELFLDIEYPDTRRLMKNFEYHLGYSKDPPEYWKRGQFYFQVQQLEEFASERFPQDFGTNHTWGSGYAGGRTYLESTDNAILKLMSANGYNPDHSAYPSNLIDGLLEWSDPYFEQFGENTPVEITWRWNGNVKLKEFRIRGWLQQHEPGSSPMEFAFFGSNDGNNWIEICNVLGFENTDGKWSAWYNMELLESFSFHKIELYNNWNGMVSSIKFNQIEFKAEGEIEVN